MGGGYYSTFVATNKEFNINNADINNPFQVTLNGTIIASAYGDRAGGSIFIVNNGATLNIDADTDGGSVVTENIGSVINRTTTRLGAMTADLDMNNHSIKNVKVDSIGFQGGGGITKIDYEDAVTKKHTQNTDTKLKYVTPIYSNFITGGTPSANSEITPAANACDGDIGTYWYQSATLPAWWKYDLGVGITKTARKLRMITYPGYIKNFTLEGSNNNSDWTLIYTGIHLNNGSWQEYLFSNATAYRYYKVNFANNYGGDNQIAALEIEILNVIEDIGSDDINTRLNTITSALDEKTSKATANIVYYIDPATGNDNNPGTSALPLKTLTKADSLLPDNLNGKSVNIVLKPGTYTEYFQPRRRTSFPNPIQYQIVGQNVNTCIWKAPVGWNNCIVVDPYANSFGVAFTIGIITFDSNNLSNITFVRGDIVSIGASKFTKSGTETNVTAVAATEIYSFSNSNGAIPIDNRFEMNSPFNNTGYIEHDGSNFAGNIDTSTKSYIEYNTTTFKRYFRNTYGTAGDKLCIQTVGDIAGANESTPSDIYDAVQKKHSPNTDTGASGNFAIVGELSIRVYSQAAEPTLGADNRMAIWIDTDDSNRVYLLFRRGSGDQVAVELG
jgi:hypothetical protein